MLRCLNRTTEAFLVPVTRVCTPSSRGQQSVAFMAEAARADRGRYRGGRSGGGSGGGEEKARTDQLAPTLNSGEASVP